MSEVRCKEVDCRLKGFHEEEKSDGSKVVVIKTKHRGEKHIVELTKDDAKRIWGLRDQN